MVKTAGVRAAASVAPAPLWAIPILSSAVIVWTTPCLPALRMWLFASETQSMPAYWSPARRAWLKLKIIPVAW